MAYGDYLGKISEKFESLFREISAGYNFDFGPEFEIALCKVLRIILPSKFGICRGFVVTSSSVTAGDDIIIFDQERFPTLRLLEDNTFAQKQRIPVEAVYAYIEAKHTLYLDGGGGQSLAKACEQVTAVKSLPRPQLALSKLSPQVSLGEHLKLKRDRYWPSYWNPLYGAIVARHIKLKADETITTANEILPHVSLHASLMSRPNTLPPDLLILSSDIVCLPAVGSRLESPFYIQGDSRLVPFLAEGKSFGVGVTNLSWALDSIMLGNIHWPSVLAFGLNLELENPLPES